jgi:hypothetical protein
VDLGRTIRVLGRPGAEEEGNRGRDRVYADADVIWGHGHLLRLLT